MLDLEGSGPRPATSTGPPLSIFWVRRGCDPPKSRLARPFLGHGLAIAAGGRDTASEIRRLRPHIGGMPHLEPSVDEADAPAMLSAHHPWRPLFALAFQPVDPRGEVAPPGSARALLPPFKEDAPLRPKRSRETPLVKLGPPEPDEQRYAVAIRDGSNLWLTLWVRCSHPKGEIFVMLPRRDRGWNVHASYHCNGTMHIKAHGDAKTRQKGQKLTTAFRGFQRFVHFSGHGKATGEICDPKAFDGVVCVEPGILAPDGGSVAVDLVEPGHKMKAEPSGPIRRLFPRGPRPSVVITIYPADQDPLWWKWLEWPDDFVKVE